MIGLDEECDTRGNEKYEHGLTGKKGKEGGVPETCTEHGGNLTEGK